MKYSLITLVFVFLISCISNDDSVEPEIDYTAQNEQEILDYIQGNNLVAEKSNSGLYYVINEIGNGEQPVLTSNVTVIYKGYFTDGTVIDETESEGVSLNLRELISGFAEGLTYFKEGGTGVILVPSRLAYGNDGIAGVIPPGAVIIFDIELISVN